MWTVGCFNWSTVDFTLVVTTVQQVVALLSIFNLLLLAMWTKGFNP